MTTERKECWFTETANVFLAQYLKNHLPRVFEFGMGSSTLYLARKSHKLTSVDHDSEWYEKIRTTIRAKRILHKTTALFLLNRPYHLFITHYPKKYFDIVIVDGRDRVKCITSSIARVKKGGMLIVDNSEREYYQAGIDLLKDWNRMDFRQNRPDKYGFTYPDWTTSIFIKP